LHLSQNAVIFKELKKRHRHKNGYGFFLQLQLLALDRSPNVASANFIEIYW